MNISKLENNIELLSGKVHESWEKEKISQGFHSPDNCPSENKRSYMEADWQSKDRFDDHFNSKFYKWCDKCHSDLYPYNELPENIKEYDRVTVKTVLNAIRGL